MLGGVEERPAHSVPQGKLGRWNVHGFCELHVLGHADVGSFKSVFARRPKSNGVFAPGKFVVLSAELPEHG